MAAKHKTMDQVRMIIQAHLKGESKRWMERQLGMSRNTIRTYIKCFDECGVDWPDLLLLNDEELGSICFERAQKVDDERKKNLFSNLKKYIQELKDPKVTRQLLWEEYRQAYPEGYEYTQFCHYLKGQLLSKQVTAMFTHSPGDKMEVDYAGSTLSYVHCSTGELIQCQVLLAVLPYSNKIFCYATRSQKQIDFVSGLSKALEYFEGVPGCIMSDNLKSAVKKADRYEPSFTELCEQLSVYYRTTMMATRVRKPRDKASVEGAVRIAYNRVYARLRNKVFHSQKELNKGIEELLKDLNNRNFKGKDYSRNDLFEKHERNLLSPLPTERFEVKKTITPKVQRNYHVILGEDTHQYSVPYEFVSKTVKAIYTCDHIEIYHDHKRIAIHERNRSKLGYTTLADHMPSNHKAVYEQKGWNASYFIKEAAKIGPHTQKAVQQILESKVFPEQTFKSCIGLIKLAKVHTQERLEVACQMMIDHGKTSYTSIKTILKNKTDLLYGQASIDFSTPSHDNIRGKDFY